jgi:hypothetical protein
MLVSDVQKVEEGINLVSLLEKTAIFFWKDWPRDMRLSSVRQDGNGFTLRGTCPHCGAVAAFPTVVGTFDEHPNTAYARQISVARGACCNEYILAIIQYSGGGWEYEIHYPLGKPDDSVDKNVPESIRRDFGEALRCQWVNAWNATAEMCRRTVESSCIDLEAPYSKVLQEMIEWLYSKGKITETLKDVAHKIRLGGDRAAHPPEDTSHPPKYEPMVVIEEEHANAIVNFTRHFLEHVYVIPKQLPTFDFSKPKKL